MYVLFHAGLDSEVESSLAKWEKQCYKVAQLLEHLWGSEQLLDVKNIRYFCLCTNISYFLNIISLKLNL